MARQKLTVVISQAQGKHPQKRQLEEDLAAKLMMQSHVDVSLVPHLYDMAADHPGLLFLRGLTGDVVVLSWLYPRAARWTLHRQGIKGQIGVTLLAADDTDEDPDEVARAAEAHLEAAGEQLPRRRIYTIDLRAAAKPQPFLDEVARIVAERSVDTVDLMSWVKGSPQPAQLERYLQADPPQALTQLTTTVPLSAPGQVAPMAGSVAAAVVPPEISSAGVGRRWYPVIDYSRCTNCMECIDFCLFGVYGVDRLDRILVEAQDNCKKGCPACSRVCPENAIMFPQHKSAAIAGAEGEIAGLKIDLSSLFGGTAANAVDQAIAERDAELVKDGREAVGASVGLPKRREKSGAPADELDALMDDLDAAGL